MSDENKVKTVTECNQFANAAVLREAMKKIVNYVEPIRKHMMPKRSLSALFAVADTIYEIGTKALAVPPRNCDIYNAREAEKAFIAQTGSKSIRAKSVRWLLSPATEGGNEQ